MQSACLEKQPYWDMFKIACLKQCLFRTGKFEEEDKLKVVKVVSLDQVILNTVVLRAGLAQMITDYICTVMINWTVSSENCDKGFFFSGTTISQNI